MDVCLYASDLTDTGWALLAPLIPRSYPAGRRQTYPLRRIVDAIFYLLRTGVQWRLLPHEFPPRGAVFSSADQRRRPPAPVITSRRRTGRGGSSIWSNINTKRSPIRDRQSRHSETRT